MKAAIAILIAMLSVSAADLRIDHVTVAGADLASMRQAFTAATGLVTEYGGPHANHATEMALTSFPDGSYLEFIAIQPHADPAAVAAQPWHLFMTRSAGPCAFAIRVEDVKAESARLKAAGVAVGATESSGRTRPDGTQLAWETASMGPGLRGTFLPFLIRDLTPRERRAFPSGRPTTDRFRGIGRVVIGVADLNDAIGQYQRAFGMPAPLRQYDRAFDADLVWFEGTPIILAQGTNGSSWLSRRVREYGNAPCAFILTAAGGLTGAFGSRWFGRTIIWTDANRLGWRLGMEATSPARAPEMPAPRD